MADTLDRQLDRICGRVLRLDDDLPAQIWALLEPQVHRCLGGLSPPGKDHEVEALHELRTRAKRLRYALELFKPTLGDAYRPLRKPTKQIQRILGEHHDVSLLAQTLRLRREQLASRGLHTLAQGLQPLEDELLARRRVCLQRAQPALRVLVARRYVEIAQRQLGIDPAIPSATPTLGRIVDPPTPET